MCRFQRIRLGLCFYHSKVQKPRRLLGESGGKGAFQVPKDYSPVPYNSQKAHGWGIIESLTATEGLLPEVPTAG